jgi:hypothetical protein
MAKRMTDTEKWDDPFFADLPPIYKLIYLYILDKCDAVGVWKINKRLVEFHMNSNNNENVGWDGFLSYMGNRILIINDEKLWLTKFCDFQYGELSEDSTSKPIISYIKMLKKHTLWIPYTRGIHTPKEKEKEKDKEKEKEKEKDTSPIYRKFKHLKITEFEILKLQKKFSISQIDDVLDDIENHKNNKNYSSLYLTANKWLKKAHPNNNPTSDKPITYTKEFTLE